MLIGQRILGRYTVEDIIGSGGQSEIALAAADDGGTVVVKQLISDPSESGHTRRLARFRREGSIRVGHPGVLEPIESATEDNEHVIVFPYIEGADLASVFGRRPGALPIREAVGLMIATGEAVAALHDAGIVHRDLKPANIIIDTAGAPHLIDLGIAKCLGQETISSPETTVLGTPQWMAPEQFDSTNVDARADVFALGLLLFFAITGRCPRQGADTDTLRGEAFRRLEPPSTINSLISPELDEVCRVATSVDPKSRMTNAREFSEMLRASCPHRCLACGRRLADPSGPRCPGCGRAFSSEHPRLEFDDGQTFLIPHGDYETGRYQIRPTDQRVSRRQFIVSCNGEISIHHANGPNTTRVGGVTATRPIRLSDGNELRIARLAARFASDSL